MKILISIFTLSAVVSFASADENHEIIAKAMKDGLKGKTSLLAKTLDGTATAEEIKTLNELIATLKGTKTPRGDQKAYEEKIEALVKASAAVAGGDKGEAAIKALKGASNCKSCHKDHKPEKEKKQ